MPSSAVATAASKASRRQRSLGRFFHLDQTDLDFLATRRRDHNRLGMAVQLATVRFLGTFLDDRADVPPGAVRHVAEQLALARVIGDIAEALRGLKLYRDAEVRWDHQGEIRSRFGYREFSEPGVQLGLLRWLYARAWVAAERPSVLFDLATARLVEAKVLLPGASVLARMVARVRERVARRLGLGWLAWSTTTTADVWNPRSGNHPISYGGRSTHRVGVQYPIPSARGQFEHGSRIGLLAQREVAVAAWTESRYAEQGDGRQAVRAARIEVEDDGGGRTRWTAAVVSAAVVLTAAALWRRRTRQSPNRRGGLGGLADIALYVVVAVRPVPAVRKYCGNISRSAMARSPAFVHSWRRANRGPEGRDRWMRIRRAARVLHTRGRVLRRGLKKGRDG